MATEKTNQGTIGSVSPAMGPYKISTDIDIAVGYTGVAGEIYEGSLQPTDWDQGVTGISGSNFTNTEDGEFGTTYR